MAFDTFTNGTSANAIEVNTAFQTTVMNASNTIFGNLSKGQTNFYDSILLRMSSTAPYDSTTGFSFITTSGVDSGVTSFEIGYVPATSGTTSVDLQTNFFPLEKGATATMGSVVGDYVLLSQYGDVQDLNDGTYWTGSGTTTATKVSNGGTRQSNDLADADKKIVFLCSVGGAGGYDGRVAWVDNTGTNVLFHGAAGLEYALFEIYIDTTNTTAIIFMDGKFVSNAVYDTTFAIKIYTEAGTTLSQAYCYSFSDGASASSTTVTHELTADGGGNWETATLNEGHKFTNTGSVVGYRNQFTLQANEFIICRKGLVIGGWY